MKKLVQFIKNIWVFRKSLWNFRWWDYHYTMDMMKTCLQVMSDNFETKGIEIDGPRMKKVVKMRRAIEIMNNRNGVYYIDMAEKELGQLFEITVEFKDSETSPGSYELFDNLSSEEKKHNKKVYARAEELEEEEWEELWNIFEGQDVSKYKPKKQDWDDWFDGTGIRGWWD